MCLQLIDEINVSFKNRHFPWLLFRFSYFLQSKKRGLLSQKCAKYICPFILSWSNAHSKFIYHIFYIWNFYISPKMIWNLDIFSLFIECYIAVNLYHKTTGGTNHKLRSGRLHIKESGSDFNEFEIPSFLPSEWGNFKIIQILVTLFSLSYYS